MLFSCLQGLICVVQTPSFGRESFLSRDESFAGEVIDEDKPFQLDEAPMADT